MTTCRLPNEGPFRSTDRQRGDLEFRDRRRYILIRWKQNQEHQLWKSNSNPRCRQSSNKSPAKAAARPLIWFRMLSLVHARVGRNTSDAGYPLASARSECPFRLECLYERGGAFSFWFRAIDQRCHTRALSIIPPTRPVRRQGLSRRSARIPQFSYGREKTAASFHSPPCFCHTLSKPRVKLMCFPFFRSYSKISLLYS
jgi:hypothetical protein